MKENNQIEIAPSVLAADFAYLADEVKRAKEAGADCLHIDVMDGHFVPNLSMGPAITAAVRRSTTLFLDVHLMIYNPYDYIEQFVKSGANRITIHVEATEDVEDTLSFIRRCGVEAGLALCPETSESVIPKYLDQIDLLLLMTVSPGFGGQKFMPEVLEKIKFARDTCDQLKIRKGGVTQTKEKLPPFVIQVDGGIDAETAGPCIEAGANSLVAGTFLFKGEDPGMAEKILKLRG